MDQEQPFEVHLRDLMRDAAWRPLVLWAAGLWLLNAVMGLFGYTAVIAFQPWVWLALPVLAAPFPILSWLSRGGAPERPWPHGLLWALASCAVLPVALIVRKLAQLQAQSFSDKDTP